MTDEATRRQSLRLLCDRHGGQKRLALASKTAQSQIADMLSGRKAFGERVARRIEAELGLPRGWLDRHHVVAEQEPPTYASAEFAEVPIIGTDAAGRPAAEVEVPFYTGAAVAAGHGAENGHSAPVTLRFRAESLRRRGLTPGACAVVYVRGESMAPLLEDGDAILFSTDDRALRDGELYVIRIDGQEAVKRLHPRPGGRVLVRSENPAFPPFELAADADGFEVLGRVRWRAGWI